jgi:thymidylate synthase (FAD)
MNNEVELLGTYGSDETHALSAWTSTSRELTDTKRGRIPKLLDMLGSEGHHSPFEKSALHFLVTSDIASHIHLLKHRIGVSINAESARYKELNDDKFYVPDDWPEELRFQYISDMKDQLNKYHNMLTMLVDVHGMDRKRAKETARFYLPYGNQIKCDIMFNFRSFAHFQLLRNDEHAQKEIRDIAKEMLQLVKDTGDFDETIKALGLDQL